MSDELIERIAKALLPLQGYGPDHSASVMYPIAEAVRALVRDATLEEAARMVPTTWLDPLLTGPGATELPLDGPGVEKLCRGIAAAIRALKEKP